MTGFMRRLGLWPSEPVTPEQAETKHAPPTERGSPDESLSAQDALLKVLHEQGELDASTLYDKASELFRGDRRTLTAARWRLENEEDAIFYIVSRGTYRLRAEVRRDLDSATRRAVRGPSGREAILRALAAKNGELSPKALYDTAVRMHGGTRNAVTAGCYQLQEEGMVARVSSRGVYKLTRDGWREVAALGSGAR